MTVRNGDEIGYLLNCKLCDWVARVTDAMEAVNHAWCNHSGDTIHDVFGPGLIIQCDHFKCPNAVADRHAPNLLAVALAKGWQFTSECDATVSLGLDTGLTVTYEYCPEHWVQPHS